MDELRSCRRDGFVDALSVAKATGAGGAADAGNAGERRVDESGDGAAGHRLCVSPPAGEAAPLPARPSRGAPSPSAAAAADRPCRAKPGYRLCTSDRCAFACRSAVGGDPDTIRPDNNHHRAGQRVGVTFIAAEADLRPRRRPATRTGISSRGRRWRAVEEAAVVVRALHPRRRRPRADGRRQFRPSPFPLLNQAAIASRRALKPGDSPLRADAARSEVSIQFQLRQR